VSEILLCFFLALVALVFALPLCLSIRVDRPSPAAAVRIEIRFGFYRALAGISLRLAGPQRLLQILLLNRQLPIFRLDLRAKKTPGTKKGSASTRREKKAAQAEDQNTSTDNNSNRDILLLLRSLMHPLLRFLVRFPRVSWLSELTVNGRFGFADPAQTGSLYGFLQALRALPIKRVHFELMPDFCARGISGQLHLTLHIHLGFIIALCIRLLAQIGLRYIAMRLRFAKPRFT
jgi:hypothetical protein